MGELVSFPTEKIIRHFPGNTDLEEARKKGIQHFANTVVGEIAEQTFQFLENQGFDIESDQFNRDFSFVIDCFRAVVYRTMKLEHPLHEFIDESVVMIDKDGNEITPENTEKNETV